MRYCLACRHFSSDGPICTSCGRSFGGRLCHSKQRHLNPPDARFCGQCGATNLLDAASYIPFGLPIRFILWMVLIVLLWRSGGWFLLYGGDAFHAATGFRSPLVWAIEKSAHVLIILFVFYLLSLFLPGEAGRQFRNLVSTIITSLLGFLLQSMTRVFAALGRLLQRLISHQAPRQRQKKQEH